MNELFSHNGGNGGIDGTDCRENGAVKKASVEVADAKYGWLLPMNSFLFR
ncbi:hypothetical protein [Serratia symbiotica]|nr:hypothetical protein [Serratia symbiotica]